MINLSELFYNIFAWKIHSSEYECIMLNMKYEVLKIPPIPESQQLHWDTDLQERFVELHSEMQTANQSAPESTKCGIEPSDQALEWHMLEDPAITCKTLHLLCQLLGCWLNIFTRPMHMCTTSNCIYSRSFNNILVLRCFLMLTIVTTLYITKILMI